MATIATAPIDRQSAERKFYTRMTLFLIALVLLGFGPSFYLRGIVPAYPRPNPTLPLSVMIHGGLFTLWMLLLLAQTQLVAAGRRDLHMKLGAAGMLLALVIIPTMYLVAIWQVERPNRPPFTDPLNWTIVPLSVIPAFAYLVWTGWSRRRDAQWHKRAMLSAAMLVVMGPAIARLPIAPPTFAGFACQLLLGLALFVPLILWDRRSIGRVHPATWRGLTVSALVVAVSLGFLATASWAPIAARLPGI